MQMRESLHQMQQESTLEASVAELTEGHALCRAS